jgi:hypothetical protein
MMKKFLLLLLLLVSISISVQAGSFSAGDIPQSLSRTAELACVAPGRFVIGGGSAPSLTPLPDGCLSSGETVDYSTELTVLEDLFGLLEAEVAFYQEQYPIAVAAEDSDDLDLYLDILDFIITSDLPELLSDVEALQEKVLTNDPDNSEMLDALAALLADIADLEERIKVLLALDSDNDSILDSDDNCYFVANADQVDADGDEVGDACDDDATDGPLGDQDNDSIPNETDNCPLVANADQVDADGDGIGDVCVDNDSDGDGFDDGVDNCPLVANADQVDNDGDGLGAACDENDASDTSDGSTDSGTSTETFEERLDGFEKDFRDFEDDFENLEDDYAAELRIGDEDEIENIEDDLKNLDDDLKSLEDDIEALEDEVKDADNDDPLLDDIEDLFDDINQLQDDIDNLLRGETSDTTSSFVNSYVPSTSVPLGTSTSQVVLEPFTFPTTTTTVQSSGVSVGILVLLILGIVIVGAVVLALLMILLRR